MTHSPSTRGASTIGGSTPPARPYEPTPWLKNPHLQTIWGRLFGKRTSLHFERQTISTPDDDAVDILSLRSSAKAPVLLLLHGLEGGEGSHYVGGTLSGALAYGWYPNLLLFRTCNGSLNRQARSYHSGETSDLDLVVRHLLTTQPSGELFLAGVSLGGNVLLKWLGEKGTSIDPRIVGAAAISVPFDLARASRHIDKGLSTIYSRRFLRSLKAKALKKIDRHPGIASKSAITAVGTLWDFDNVFTAPVHGFRNAADYYEQSSSINYLSAIRVKTLLLSSHDDPFTPPGLLDEVSEQTRVNPLLFPEFVDVGGHVGFVEGVLPWRLSSYSERRIVEFASSCLAMSRSLNAR